jgi:hypothetical protein
MTINNIYAEIFSEFLAIKKEARKEKEEEK